jgi:hypothetical protein
MGVSAMTMAAEALPPNTRPSIANLAVLAEALPPTMRPGPPRQLNSVTCRGLGCRQENSDLAVLAEALRRAAAPQGLGVPAKEATLLPRIRPPGFDL